MCSLSISVRIIGLLSILLGLAVVGTSSWLLKTSYEHRESGYGDANKAISSVGNFLYGTTGDNRLRIDPDQVDRTKIWVSAATLAAGALQLITSIFLLFCSSSKGGRTSAKLWLFINFFVILTTTAGFICLMSQEHFRDEVQNDNRDKEHQLKGFLAAIGIDAIFLFITSFITGSFGCRSGN